MFRFQNQHCSLAPQSGIRVTARGKVSLYSARGDYQLIIEHLEPAGAGALQQAFEALKQQLALKGWFDPTKKKSLPQYPSALAIVTSANAAALQDILDVLKRRAPCIQVKVFPTQVQGKQAWESIVQQIQAADQDPDTQAIILARGGGSIEDLWNFNEQGVAEAIHHCTKPTITGIGHQTDTTIADFVADMCAPTPSAAAELASFEQSELTAQLERVAHKLQHLILNQINHLKKDLTLQSARLKRPDLRLQEWQQQVDYIEKRLSSGIHAQLNRHAHALSRISQSLNAFSPLNTLARGYAIVSNNSGRIIHNTQSLNTGETLNIQLAQGSLQASISQIKHA